MKTISHQYKKQVNQVLKALLSYDPQKVILFGSVARGEAKKNSDLDLFIIKKTKKRFTERSYEVVDRYLSSIDYHFPVDVVIYTPSEFEKAKKENRIFLEKILREGRILYERT